MIWVLLVVERLFHSARANCGLSPVSRTDNQSLSTSIFLGSIKIIPDERYLSMHDLAFATLTCCKQSAICRTLVGPSARILTPRQPEPGLSLQVLMHCSIGIWLSLVIFAGPSTASTPEISTNAVKRCCTMQIRYISSALSQFLLHRIKALTKEKNSNPNKIIFSAPRKLKPEQESNEIYFWYQDLEYQPFADNVHIMSNTLTREIWPFWIFRLRLARSTNIMSCHTLIWGRTPLYTWKALETTQKTDEA